jgi:hypothetical protein
MASAKRLSLLAGATLLSALLAAPAAGAADRLPDLGMARLADFKIDKTFDGRRLLRYTTVIVNVGSGRFEVRGQRASTAESEMSVSQRVYNDTGGFRDLFTPARMFFAGDGHSHWHVRDLESSDLVRLDNGSKVGTGAKRGFCFYDNYRYGSSSAPFYGGCGHSPDLAVTMGVSVGWGDEYHWSLPDQWIDITGLTAGRYRLIVTADNSNWFVESNEANNATWVDLQLKGNGAPRVVGYGPAA